MTDTVNMGCSQTKSESAAADAHAKEDLAFGEDDRTTYIYERDESEYASKEEYQEYQLWCGLPTRAREQGRTGTYRPVQHERSQHWSFLSDATLGGNAVRTLTGARASDTSKRFFSLLDWADYGDLGAVDSALPLGGDTVQMRGGKPYFEDHFMLRKCYFEEFSLEGHTEVNLAVGDKFYLIVPEGCSADVCFKRWDVGLDKSAYARLARRVEDGSASYELWRVEIPLRELDLPAHYYGRLRDLDEAQMLKFKPGCREHFFDQNIILKHWFEWGSALDLILKPDGLFAEYWDDDGGAKRLFGHPVRTPLLEHPRFADRQSFAEAQLRATSSEAAFICGKIALISAFVDPEALDHNMDLMKRCEENPPDANGAKMCHKAGSRDMKGFADVRSPELNPLLPSAAWHPLYVHARMGYATACIWMGYVCMVACTHGVCHCTHARAQRCPQSPPNSPTGGTIAMRPSLH